MSLATQIQADAAALAVAVDAVEAIPTNVAAGLTRSSTTSLTPGTGSKAFTFTAASAYTPWGVGSRVRAASAAAPTTKWMSGIVTAEASSTLTMTVDDFAGSVAADWVLAVSGEKGPTGPTGPTGPMPDLASPGPIGGTTPAAASFTAGYMGDSAYRYFIVSNTPYFDGQNYVQVNSSKISGKDAAGVEKFSLTYGTGAGMFTTFSIGANAVVIGGAVTFSGAFAFTGTLTGATTVTFPTSGILLNTSGGEMPPGSNQFVIAGPDAALADFDPRVIGFDAERGALFGGRLNRGLDSGGELQHGVFDPALISQYSVTWGWSQVSIGESIGSAGAKTKGSMQIGYGCANAAQFATLSGLANVTLGPACDASGWANISGSTTRSGAPVNLTYCDNYAAGPVAVLKVAGDRTAEFPVGEYLLLGGFAAVAEGPLTTRTSDTAGVFTLSSGAAGTALDVGEAITVKWSGGANGRTLVISASSVAGAVYTVTAAGGTGDVLPAAATKVWFTGGANVGTPRVVYAKPTAVSHSGGVTTITLDRQFAVTFDITRAAPESPWVMNVGTLNSVLYGSNSATGDYNRALGRRGRISGYRNLIPQGTDGADVAGTTNTSSGQNSFTRGTSNAVSGDDAGGWGSGNTVSGARSAAWGTSNTISGSDSFGSGSTNTVSGTRSAAVGILNNNAGTDALVVGNGNTISTGVGTVLNGLSNSSAANYSQGSGQSNIFGASAHWSRASGRSNAINNPYSDVSGRGAVTRRYGEQVHSNGVLTVDGGMQSGVVLYGGYTTNATQTDLFLDWQESVPAERFDLATASAATCRLTIHATGPGTGADNSTGTSGVKCATFMAEGLLLRTSSGGAYAWHGDTAPAVKAYGVAISSLTGSGTVVTAVTTGEHGLNTGDSTVIAGASIVGYNGTVTVTRVDRTTFTYAGVTVGAASGATSTPVIPWTVALSASSGLRIQVTGAGATAIKWVARCEFVEVSQ